MSRLGAVALLALAGCGFEHGRLGTGDAGTTIDDAPDAALTPDASLCMGASVECADPLTLRTCTTAGVAAVDKTCNWGCLETGTPHCGVVTPTTGSVTTNEVTTFTNLQDTDLVASIIVNTTTGEIGNQNQPDVIHDNNVGIDNGIDMEIHGSNPGVTVFRFRRLIVSGNITIIGSRAVAFVADQDITISGVVDARGRCTNLGKDVGGEAGPGGFQGGAQNLVGLGTGGGGGGTSTNTKGGGGGGHGGTGGIGGNTGGAGGMPYNTTLTALVGGSGGGGGGGGGGNSQPGGGGGGAIQMISNKAITFTSSGGINAGGCGGFSTTGPDSGGGGGAGGLIILQAPSISLAGGIAVNGGGGGGGPGAAMTSGLSGQLSRVPATGAIGGDGLGGAGGAGGLPNGTPGTFGTKSGGGGGAIGRIRIETRGGTHFTQDAASVMSPNLTDTGTTASHVAATVN